jgi:copper chaperone CopZ
MAVRTETLQVTGIRCERCVLRLGTALGAVEGLEAANANLVGEVCLSWDEERVDLDAIVEAMGRAGFWPAAATAAE